MKGHVIPPTYATIGERTKAAFDWEVSRDVALKVARAATDLGQGYLEAGYLTEAGWHFDDAMRARARAVKYDRNITAVRATPIATPETDR